MGDQMQAGMVEAARLTREGRLAEATAIIQSALGGTFAPTANGSGGTDETIEATFHVVDESEALRAASTRCRRAAGRGADRATRHAPESPLEGFRGLPQLPNGLPVTMPGVSEGTPGIVPSGGRFVERSYNDRAGTRAYKLYIPSGYVVGKGTPLVVMLHGCTQNPDDFAAGTHMNVLAEEHTFLVAYPAQAQNANMSRCWNWFEASDQQRGRGEPSLIAGITRQVVDEYDVDAGRVYVAGMSAGGAMAAIMGETYPDLYAAIGVHSGLAPGAAHDLSSAFTAMRGGSPGGPAVTRRDPVMVTSIGKLTRAVPTIVFHGDCDTTVHPRNGDQLLAHFAVDTVASDRKATGGSATQARVRQGQVPGGHTYTCSTYHDAGDHPIMERWTVHGLKHAWSGGSLPGSYTDPKGPDASKEMVRFFKQHSLRESVERPVD